MSKNKYEIEITIETDNYSENGYEELEFIVKLLAPYYKIIEKRSNTVYED